MHLWIKPFFFLSIPTCTRTHTHTPPELYVPHSPEPSGTDNQHETPCYPVPPACLQMLQSCQLQPVKSFNLLHVFPYTEPSRRQQSNTCKNKQIVRSRRTCMRKIAPKNLCAYPICHYEWQGPAELRQGRASAWKVSFQHHGERHWFQSAAPGQLQHWQLDSSTNWLSGVKETREPSPGTGRSGVRKAGCNPGELIRDWN